MDILFGSFMVMPFGYQELMETDWASFDWGIWVSVAYIIIGGTFLPIY